MLYLYFCSVEANPIIEKAEDEFNVSVDPERSEIILSLEKGGAGIASGALEQSYSDQEIDVVDSGAERRSLNLENKVVGLKSKSKCFFNASFIDWKTKE